MMPRNFTLLLVALLLPFGIQAGVYRWVDENGVTVYSQTPPLNDTRTTRIETPSAPPAGEDDTYQNLENQWQKMQDREDIRKEQGVTEAEQEKVRQEREENCKSARNNLEILRGSTRKLIMTPDGEYHRITPEERQKHLEEAEKMQEESCN